MKKWNDYVATCYVLDTFGNIEIETKEELIRDAFQQNNPDIIIQKVCFDILYMMYPTIENTLKIYIHYKEEDKENEEIHI